MNRETLDRWCERGILGLVLAILIFGPLAIGAVRLSLLLVIQGLMLGVLLLWGLRLWWNERPRFLWPPVCWIALAFVGFAVFRYTISDIEYVAREQLIRTLLYALLFFAAVNNLHRQESTQIISFTLIFLAMGISCYAVYQFFTGSPYVWNIPTEPDGRASGTYVSPNHLAGFLEMVLPLGIAYTLAGRVKPVMRILLGYASLVMLAGIGVTVSRGGWVAAGVGLIFLFAVLTTHRNYRLPALVLLVFLVGIGGFGISKTSYFKERFKRGIAVGKNFEVDTRHELWTSAVRMWQDERWLGVGPGHYDYRFRQYRPESVQLRPDWVHNDYLNTLVEWGVIGSAFAVLGLGVLLAGVIKTWPYVRRGERDFSSNFSNKFAFVLGASAGLLALLVHSIVDFNLQIPANAILATMLAALLSSHLRFATERYWFGAGWTLKTIASVMLLGAIGWLGYQEFRLGQEQVWLHRARKAPLLSPAWSAAMEKAAAVEPNNFKTTYAIAEGYRMQSFKGGSEYAELATNAMTWFQAGMTNNPLDGYNFIGYGRCLDWLERYDEAEPYFIRADELDPNGYFTQYHVGWHFVEAGDYAAARPWFERSLRLEWRQNDAVKALELVNSRLLEQTTRPNLLLPGGNQ